MPVQRDFRFDAIKVFLTYSQVGERTKEDIFFTIDERYPVKDFFLGEERHQDGGRHIHAVFVFKAKVSSRSAQCFDVWDGEKWLHPNIKTIRRGKAHLETVVEYAGKDDPHPLTNMESKPSWGELIEQSNTAQEFLDGVRKWYPRDYALNLQRYEYSAAKMYGNCPNTLSDFVHDWDLELPDELRDLQVSTVQSTVIVGPPGCGKTTWAKENAPKPALFIRHMDSLALLRAEHASIIFDDLDFHHLPPSTQKFLVDMENLAEIHLRYRVAKIPAGLPRIITANEYPFLAEGVHGDAITRRIFRVDIQ